MISIGTVLKGDELSRSPVDQAIMAATKAISELRGNFAFGSSPAVNVVFHVPGSMGNPNWDGLREATFSRSKQLLMVQVAVPEDVVSGAGIRDFVVESLYGANAVAFEFFRQKKMTFQLKDAEKLVKNVEAQLYLKQFAQLNLFWVLKTASIQPGLIHYLGADGIAYAMMDEIDDRVAKCITFLEPVFKLRIGRKNGTTPVENTTFPWSRTYDQSHCEKVCH